MKAELADAWHTIVPPRDGPHGPLPALLTALTLLTGLVDAFSYLCLGHVFVANMTGNVVFLAFAADGAAGFVWWTSVLAIVTFSVGALVGGRLAHRASHRGQHLLIATAAQQVLITAAIVVAELSPSSYDGFWRAGLITVLGVTMGLQNATARALGVPDLTTTVLTLTITGISADSAVAGGAGSHIGRRVVSIASMFLGALVGVVLIHSGHSRWILLVALVLLIGVANVAARARASTAEWTVRKP
ncbi:MAG TPA: YoaK family protein [Mycobacteriales bacterium]|jgi:uncharacterized membrane protein YoaK (UPF0700 family)|nr:YoaK family protein [Mycobacteriales bacterium]